MEQYTYHIFYTSDVHGSLSTLDESSNVNLNKGLTTISTYLKQMKEPYLLLDNGDTIQGSQTMYHWVSLNTNEPSPINKIMNAMKYDYVNIGNHDFNYGQEILKKYTNHLNATVLCCNIYHNDHLLFQPYDIICLPNQLKIGIIGAVTHYIPHWEKPNQIKNLRFVDAFDAIKETLSMIHNQVDYTIVLYHGGFEKDPFTGIPIGRQTTENQGYKIASELNIDLLLTGHQHMKISNCIINGTQVMQTSHNAFDFGHIKIDFLKNEEKWFAQNTMTELIQSTEKDDVDILNLITDDINQTQIWLDRPIGNIKEGNLIINNPFLSRLHCHPIYQLINDMQKDVTKAMISAASLPNHALGFHQNITIRDIEATFLYPNSLYVIEVTGRILKQALEKTASYFQVMDDEITVNPSFIYPKLEHYNYDVYDGISYTINVSQPIGSRIENLTYNNCLITDDQIFTLAINNYRAIGGGDYHMFEQCKIIDEYEIPLSELMIKYIKKEKYIHPRQANHIQIIK